MSPVPPWTQWVVSGWNFEWTIPLIWCFKKPSTTLKKAVILEYTENQSCGSFFENSTTCFSYLSNSKNAACHVLYQFHHWRKIWTYDLRQTHDPVWFYLRDTAGNPDSLQENIVSSTVSHFRLAANMNPHKFSASESSERMLVLRTVSRCNAGSSTYLFWSWRRFWCLWARNWKRTGRSQWSSGDGETWEGSSDEKDMGR